MPVGDELSRSDRARRFFADLSEFLASKNSTDGNGPSVTADEWKAKLNELEVSVCYLSKECQESPPSFLQAVHDYPFPNDTNWQHCRGSRWKYRGYTCGLWSLFHTLTINAYLEDGLSKSFSFSTDS